MSHTAFDRIAEDLDAPMVIVTARVGDAMSGCLVGFSTQCSVDPPRYLVCLSKKNRTYEIACDASMLVVHMLHYGAHDRSLASLLGEQTAHDVDKLAECDWRSGPDAIPVLAGCDWFAGTIVDRFEFGDHVGFVLDVHDGEAPRAGEANLTFAQVRDLDAGNPP